MAHDPLLSMNNALDQGLSEQELDALHRQIEESEEAATAWEKLRKTDELLRTTPMVAPLPGFTSRVMAAIAAMPLPGFAQHPGIGIVLGLLAAAFIAVPIFAALFFVLLSVLTDPGALQEIFQTILNTVGYMIGMVADLASEIESVVEDTPVLAALLTTMIPV
ncbi:MAG: hypothetical protein EHM39_13280, partial [Chloroflexi bacterium]